MIESARMARLLDFLQLIAITGLGENSESEMAPSRCRQHIGKGESRFPPVPGSRFSNKVLGGRGLLHKPKDYEGIGPVCKHGSTNNRLLFSALRFSRAQELLGLTIGNLNAPTCAIPLNNVFSRSRHVSVEEYRVRIFAVRITAKHYGEWILAGAMIPESSELMDRQSDPFPIAEDLDFGPAQIGVFKHGCRSRQSPAFLSRPTSRSFGRCYEKSVQGRVFPQPSCDMNILGPSFQDGVAAVSKIGNDPHTLPCFEPRMGQVDKFETKFRLLLVRQVLRFDFGFWGPPKPCSIRQTEHSVADSRKSYRQTCDDETDSIPLLFGVLWGRAVVLPTGSADFLPAVLVQGVVKDHEDLDSFGNQCFHQDSEEATGHHVSAPLPFPQESVDRGEMPGFVKLHRKNDLTDGVFANGQHPTDDKRHEDAETGSAEAPPESDLVNLERIWYMFLHRGVPPPHLFFPKLGMRGTPRLFKQNLGVSPNQTLQKARNYSSYSLSGKAYPNESSSSMTQPTVLVPQDSRTGYSTSTPLWGSGGRLFWQVGCLQGVRQGVRSAAPKLWAAT